MTDLKENFTPLEVASLVSKNIRDNYLIYCIQETGELAIYREGKFIRGFAGNKIVESIVYDEILEVTKPLIPTPYIIRVVMTSLNSDWLISRKEFDKDENRASVLNGFLYLNNEYKKWSYSLYFNHDEDPYKTFIQLPIYYDIKAGCPNIMEFLEATFGLDNITLILQIIGYCMFTTVKFEKSFVLYGIEDSGKTTFISLLRRFIGYDNCTEVSLQDLQNRFKIANLRDKLVNVYDDLSFSKKLNDVAKFKQAVTNPFLSGELKNIQALGNWRNYCKQIFTCNQLPPLPSNTGRDFFRRIILISCPNKIQNKDRFILEKLTTDEELSGLLNLVLDAYEELYKKGAFPDEYDNADYIEGIWNINASPIKLFLEEMCIFDKDAVVDVNEFVVEVNKFRKDFNVPSISQNICTRELKKNKVYKKRSRRGDFYEGLSLEVEAVVDVGTLDVFK